MVAHIIPQVLLFITESSPLDLFTLCRYVAIIHPLQQRMSSTETKVVVAVIWVLALLLAFPQYYYSNTDELPGRVVCYIDWPEYTVCDFKKMWVSPRSCQHVLLIMNWKQMWKDGVCIQCKWESAKKKHESFLCFVVNKLKAHHRRFVFFLLWKASECDKRKGRLDLIETSLHHFFSHCTSTCTNTTDKKKHVCFSRMVYHCCTEQKTSTHKTRIDR